MEQNKQPFDDQSPAGMGATEHRSGVMVGAALGTSGALHQLLVSGPSGWTALTTIAAAMESPSMEVLLALEPVMQGEELREQTVDVASLPLRYAVCIDGPIEEYDSEAIERAILDGTCLLAADLRVQAAVIVRGSSIEVLSTTRRPLLAVVAQMLRTIAETHLPASAGELPLPEAELVDRLISCTGRLAVRSLEVEVYEGFVDIGIVIPEGHELGPASVSVVFDRTTKTWHTD